MFSAPHCVEHIRNNQILPPEPQTKVLAQLLYKELNCPVIYALKNNGDANFDSLCTYKTILQTYISHSNIKLCIDLHQLNPNRDTMINIGIGKGRNIKSLDIVTIIKNNFDKNHLLAKIDYPFSASNTNTILRITSYKNITLIFKEILDVIY